MTQGPRNSRQRRSSTYGPASLVQEFRGLDPRARLRLRRIVTGAWLLLLLALGIWVARNQRSDLIAVSDHLRNADRRWLAMCVLAELAGITSVGLTYSLVARRLGYRVSVGAMTYIHVQRIGVGFAAPFGGPITAYVFTERMRRFRIPGADALLILALRTSAVWGATLVVVIVTAALSENPLAIAGAILGFVAAGALLYGILRSGQGDWKTILRWSDRLPGRQRQRVAEAIDRFKTHDLTPTDWLTFIGVTLLTRTATISLIYASIRALGVDPPISLVFFAYVASFIAGRLVPFLYSMGAIEGSLSLALERGGIPIEIAIGATLLFRAIDFFLPSVVGLALYSWDERHAFRGTRASLPGPPSDES
jgi:phosphatidylglycerol lysyltransferase